MTTAQLPPNARGLEALFEKSGGALTPDILTQLRAIGLSATGGPDQVVALIRDAEEQKAVYDTAVDEAKAAARALDTRIDTLKTFLLGELDAGGLTRAAGARFVVQVHTNPPKIAWTGTADTIPLPFRRTKIELDGTKARAALSDGALPDGFTVDYGRHLRISG